MKLRPLLIEKGFIEGQDFSIQGRTLTVLEKTRPGKPIQHPAVEEVKDDQGNVTQEAKPAWEEPTTETYTADIPPLKALLLECVVREDTIALVNEYLEPFKDLTTPDDNFNIHEHLNGGEGWRFAKVPAPTLEQLYDLIDKKVSADEARQAKIDKRKAARKNLKSLDLSKATTIASIRPILKDLIDALDD